MIKRRIKSSLWPLAFLSELLSLPLFILLLPPEVAGISSRIVFSACFIFIENLGTQRAIFTLNNYGPFKFKLAVFSLIKFS